MENYEGKVVVITGGTSGLGLALAKNLGERGARIVITGRNAEKGAAVEAELKGAVAQLDLGAGYPARGIAGRVVSPEEWRHGR